MDGFGAPGSASTAPGAGLSHQVVLSDPADSKRARGNADVAEGTLSLYRPGQSTAAMAGAFWGNLQAQQLTEFLEIVELRVCRNESEMADRMRKKWRETLRDSEGDREQIAIDIMMKFFE